VEDFYVVEMKYEEEEDNNLQVTTQALIFRVIVLSLSSLYRLLVQQISVRIFHLLI
jgi:hypothetical protein